MKHVKLATFLVLSTGVLALPALLSVAIAEDCEDECPINNICAGVNVQCPQCFGFGLGSLCGLSTALEHNPAAIVIRKRVPTGAHTGETAEFQDEVICFRTATCSYGTPLPGQLCSGLANLCMSAPIPYVYCTPCGINTAWTDSLTNDYRCVPCGS